MGMIGTDECCSLRVAWLSSVAASISVFERPDDGLGKSENSPGTFVAGSHSGEVSVRTRSLAIKAPVRIISDNASVGMGPRIVPKPVCTNQELGNDMMCGLRSSKLPACCLNFREFRLNEVRFVEGDAHKLAAWGYAWEALRGTISVICTENKLTPQ